MEKLAITIDTQTLVFSKTSYIGQVHEGKVIEVISFDPMQGAIFYILDEHQSDHPVFQRAELDCTQCHVAAGTRGVPGVLLRSVFTTLLFADERPLEGPINLKGPPVSSKNLPRAGPAMPPGVRCGTSKAVSQSRADAGTYGFHATRYIAPAAGADAPSVNRSWEIPLDKPNAKGEKTQRLIVLQRGAEVSASILRVDRDTGALNGTYKDGKWILSHWDGSRPAVMELSLTKDGTLEIKPTAGRPGNTLIAYRTDVARAKGFAEPEDYTTHTTMRDPNEVFTYKFPDVDGKFPSNDDPKYKNKVVLAIMTGTWCPNRHDEAQYLVELYARYHDRGLEIVALDFEEPEQQDDLARVHAFIKQYHVPYTYLIAGAPAEMWEKVPQAVNLNTWSATLFVGRDGRVKHIHTGFASPASGEFNAQLKREFTSTIERLLKEKAEVTSAGIRRYSVSEHRPAGHATLSPAGDGSGDQEQSAEYGDRQDHHSEHDSQDCKRVR